MLLVDTKEGKLYGDEEIKLVKEFFAGSKAKIVSAYHTDKEVIEIKYIENGENKKFVFNIKTGKILER